MQYSALKIYTVKQIDPDMSHEIYSKHLFHAQDHV